MLLLTDASTQLALEQFHIGLHIQTFQLGQGLSYVNLTAEWAFRLVCIGSFGYSIHATSVKQILTLLTLLDVGRDVLEPILVAANWAIH